MRRKQGRNPIQVQDQGQKNCWLGGTVTYRDSKQSLTSARHENARVQNRPKVHPAKRQVARKNGYVNTATRLGDLCPVSLHFSIITFWLNSLNCSKDRVDRTCRLLKRRYLFVLFCFVFLPGLPRAADQNVCKQSWAAQAQLCYRKCLFPAKTEITASRPFNSLLVLSTRSLG